MQLKLNTLTIWEINPSTRWGYQKKTNWGISENLEISSNHREYKNKFPISNCAGTTYSCFSQVLCAYINHRAANSFCRIKAKGMIFIPLPWVKDLFCVNGSFIYGPRNSNINKLTASRKYKLSVNAEMYWHFWGK